MIKQKYIIIFILLSFINTSCASYTPTPKPSPTILIATRLPPTSTPTKVLQEHSPGWYALETAVAKAPPIATSEDPSVYYEGYFCDWYEFANDYMGEKICIEGIVRHVNNSENASFINFDYSNVSFYIVSFDFTFDEVMEGECIRIVGEVELYEGRPEIILRSRDQIRPCPP